MTLLIILGSGLHRSLQFVQSKSDPSKRQNELNVQWLDYGGLVT